MPRPKPRKPDNAKPKRKKNRKWLRLPLALLCIAGLVTLFLFQGYRLAPGARTVTLPARSCWNNISQIGGALLQCAFEGRLEHGAHVPMRDLLDRGYLRVEPTCFWGGKYGQVLIVGEKLICSAAGEPGHDAGLTVRNLGPFRWEVSGEGLQRASAWGYFWFRRTVK
jgi:hypothetical protein